MYYFKEECPNCGEALSGKETENAYEHDEGLVAYCPTCLLPVPVTTKEAKGEAVGETEVSAAAEPEGEVTEPSADVSPGEEVTEPSADVSPGEEVTEPPAEQ